MAVKHVVDYYNKVCDDYKRVLDTLKELEIEAQQNLIEPERIENIKKTLQPILTNYQQISYIMFLLNQPVKESKKAKYLRTNKKLLEQIAKENTTEASLERNKEALSKLKVLCGGDIT